MTQPLFSKDKASRGYALRIGDTTFGQVVYPMYEPVQFLTWRKPKTLFRNCPCKKHQGRCAGFTIRASIISMLESRGCFIVKIVFNYTSKYSAKKKQTFYVTNTARLKEAGETLDNKQMLQYSLPLHCWIKVDH